HGRDGHIGHRTDNAACGRRVVRDDPCRQYCNDAAHESALAVPCCSTGCRGSALPCAGVFHLAAVHIEPIAFEANLKITAMETVVVNAIHRKWIFVKIVTDQPGLYGWGEATLEWKTRDVTGEIEDLSPFVV